MFRWDFESDHAQSNSKFNQIALSRTPKKRFVGKARAEAVRKKASESENGVNIEDGVIMRTTSTTLSYFLKLIGRIVNLIPVDILLIYLKAVLSMRRSKSYNPSSVLN